MRTATYRLLLTVLCVAGGCRQELADPGPLPPELVVLPGALGVDHRSDGEVHSLTYELPVAYPASQQIEAITAHLAARGYKPLSEHPMNPGIPSDYVRGWQWYVDSTDKSKGEVEVDQWMASWLSPDGTWVEYALLYHDREAAGSSRLRVIAERRPKEYADSAVIAAAGEERAAKLRELILPDGTAPASAGTVR